MTDQTTHTETFSIAGMSCDHCVQSVTKELTQLDRVTAVTVDLDAGTATVTSAAPLARSAVEAAIDEAGFELSS